MVFSYIFRGKSTKNASSAIVKLTQSMQRLSQSAYFTAYDCITEGESPPAPCRHDSPTSLINLLSFQLVNKKVYCLRQWTYLIFNNP